MTQRFSLTTRLTLFYTLASATVLLGLGWLTSVSMNQHFEDLDRATLEDKIHVIQEVSGNSNSRSVLNERLKDILHSHEGLFVRLEYKDLPVFVTSDLEIPSGSVSSLRVDTKNQPVSSWRKDGHEYRALGALVTTPFFQGEQMTLWVALDTIHHAHFQRHFQTTLVTYVILATLLSGLLGWIAAHRGLTPLRVMKSRAQSVTSNRMGERMPVEAVPAEMAELARTLNEMLDRLQNDFDRLSEFSSDLAHELRTPISNLLTETQVTLTTPRTIFEYQEVLASNSEDLQRLARMVSDMLFLAKTEHGLALPSRETISISQEVQALMDFYEALASERNIQFEKKGEAIIFGDRLMLRRALSNLISNAIRYSALHSTISIEMQGGNQSSSVRVVNHGTDIEEDMLPRLFDRFFRVDKSRSQPGSDGAGLGLAITRAIMEAHGGSIEVASLDGLTSFTLLFPGLTASTKV